MQKTKNMTKKITITLSLFALVTSCGIRETTTAKQPKLIEIEDICESLTFDEGVLINGIRWATRNVNTPGTFTQNPENAGMHFQWNRRIGWSSTNPLRGSDGSTSFNQTTPQGETWEKENDPCPDGWRVPTEAELRSLHSAISEWTTKNGVTGRLFGTAPDQIFLPAAGLRIQIFESLSSVGGWGIYWSSTQSDFEHALTMHMWFSSIDSDLRDQERILASSIRCVSIEEGLTREYVYIPDHESVLINGVRWATRNVDAPGTFTENPEDFGMHFQWDRQRGWDATAVRVEDWAEVMLSPSGTMSRSRVWHPENDPCPPGWRVPTWREMQSLLDAEVSDFTQLNGVNGLFFGTAPYQIFLPAAGFRFVGGGLATGGGSYRSSRPIGSSNTTTLQIANFPRIRNDVSRAVAASVRCVVK